DGRQGRPQSFPKQRPAGARQRAGEQRSGVAIRRRGHLFLRLASRLRDATSIPCEENLPSRKGGNAARAGQRSERPMVPANRVFYSRLSNVIAVAANDGSSITKVCGRPLPSSRI